MPCSPLEGFQLAAASIVTSSTSEVLSVFRIPHMYWSTSSPSSWAGLLKKKKKKIKYRPLKILINYVYNNIVYILGEKKV